MWYGGEHVLATLESVLILDKAEEISNMILQSEIAEEYFRCKYNVMNNRRNTAKDS